MGILTNIFCNSPIKSNSSYVDCLITVNTSRYGGKRTITLVPFYLLLVCGNGSSVNGEDDFDPQ